NGVTMVMDKGLSFRQAEDLVDSCGHIIDFVKLGFGTSIFTNRADEKIALYKKSGIHPYLGGTLFEAFIKQNKFDQYRSLLDRWKLDTVEVSDGSLAIPTEEKCKYISILAKDHIVLSEVGSKDAKKEILAENWVSMMQTELEAGSFLVIAEAREGGNVGICMSDGSIHVSLIDAIFASIPEEKVLWEAPMKAQQIWFIKRFGNNVNLGNIAQNEVVALETLRNGLRGDTFHLF
ncbi:MAG: phosphosulfolactate synthase, partial [Bacteroidales bacterium]